MKDKASNRKTIFDSIRKIASVKIKISEITKNKKTIGKKLLYMLYFKNDIYSNIIIIIDKKLISKNEDTKDETKTKFIDLDKILDYKNYYSAILLDFYLQFYKCLLVDRETNLKIFIFRRELMISHLIKLLKYDKLKLEKKYQVRDIKKAVKRVLENHGYKYDEKKNKYITDLNKHIYVKLTS